MLENRVPTLSDAVNYLTSQDTVTMDQVNHVLGTVIHRAPDGGFLVSRDQGPEKMWQVEIVAELSRAPPVNLLRPSHVKLSTIFKQTDLKEKLPVNFTQ
jgi:hypothetical protein